MSVHPLWQRLKDGDHQALASIYEEHFDFLYHYGRKIISDQSTLEDTIHELFVEIWERRATLSATDQIRPYLTVAYRRKLFKAVKAASKSVELNEGYFGTTEEDNSLTDLHPSENEIKIKKSLRLLPDRQREILYLKYYGGMDYEEIAQIMDMNYQSARNLASRAVKNLSKHLLSLLLLIYWSKVSTKDLVATYDSSVCTLMDHLVN